MFRDYAERGKSTMGWCFGFKLHQICNERGELLLKKEKESLQRDKRNLKGRLSTAQSNNAKYRSVLKKRETECWIGQGDFRTNDESIGRHHTPV